MSAIRFQVMPPLAPDEYQELRDDIADRGVIEPIHVDEHGVVIDGHHGPASCAHPTIPKGESVTTVFALLSLAGAIASGYFYFTGRR